MPYIGNTPALDYISFAVQNFTVTAATTVYTLDYSVSNENDIALYINNVAQRPGSSFAYSATGTTLTLTSATLATDTMYAVFIGRAVQTVTPAAGSVTNTMLSPSVITGQTAETSIAGGDLVLIYDDSASALRKMTRTNFVSGLSVANTPAFAAYMSTDQSVADNTEVKATINTEVIDTASCYDSTTNYRFTPNVAGKYVIGATTRHSNWTANRAFIVVKFNNAVQNNGFSCEVGNSGPYEDHGWSKVITFNGTTDYVECFFYQDSGSSKSFQGENYGTYFWGFKLIGV
jgi:hypothetical protein